MFESTYQVWIGYHAILQNQSNIQQSTGVGEEALEQVQELERQTVGRVQVRQAWRLAELLEQKPCRWRRECKYPLQLLHRFQVLSDLVL